LKKYKLHVTKNKKQKTKEETMGPKFSLLLQMCLYKKVKESRNRLRVAQRVPGGLGSQIS
jgi:hypothetical protein